MDYEKAYNEAIKRAKAIIDVAEKEEEVYKSAITIFPELSESEDERIRKSLIKHFREYESCTFDGLTSTKVLAWLAKQGEHANFHNKIQIGDKVTRNEAGMLVNISQLNRIAKTRRVKPADKVEPKFHEGEWIVWKDKCYKVNYNGCGYELVDQDGLSTSLEYDTIDENAHIWDVTTDAKAGDVLASELCDSIILFKGIKDYNIDFYCDYDFSKIDIPGDRFSVNNGQHYGNIEDSKDFHPSTKEQRDTLLKAMADAGYTFDFDKKELKKIEKKSQRMVSAEAKEALYDKPDAWSEKDESIALGIEQLCNCASLLNIAPDKIDKIRTWLKSLKDRYTWKPNSEQIECLHDAINHYHTNGYPASKLNELYEQMSKIYKL